MFGADAVFSRFGDALESQTAYRMQLAIGIALIGAALVVERRDKAGKRRADNADNARRRWQPKDSSPRAMVVLALSAGVIEVASMIPYLTAIRLLTASDMSIGARSFTLVGYSLVMIVPATALIVLAQVARRLVEPILAKIGRWIEKNATEMLLTALWLVGIVLIAGAIPQI